MGEFQIIEGDALSVLRRLPASSVDCCVTSPPYWGLRDYNVDGQLGLEATPDEYVARMVEVFREVRRVLRDNGTLWLNLGDSYAASQKGSGGIGRGTLNCGPEHNAASTERQKTGVRHYKHGLKPKDLVGIPWRVAFALQADGWWLRSDIIWAKPNPMPESVTDRPTKAHEYIFLLSKSERYFYDADAVAEGSIDPESFRPRRARSPDKREGDPFFATKVGNHAEGRTYPTRNRRTVWTVTTQPYPEAHFATYPPKLIEPCIMAGCPAEGKRCDCDDPVGTPTGTGEVEDPSLRTGRAGMNRERRANEGRRIMTKGEQRGEAEQLRLSPHRIEIEAMCGPAFAHYIRTDNTGARPLPHAIRDTLFTRGWLTETSPCKHPAMPAGTVLDPFCGSGTTGIVALRLNRSFIGIELKPEYAELSRRRIEGDAPLFNRKGEVLPR